MGHIRLGSLPRTRLWNEVIALLEHGAAVDQVAHASIRAADEGLRGASRDRGTVETVWLLSRLPHAARAGDIEGLLGPSASRVRQQPGLMTLAASVSDALDGVLANNRGRTDLGEMAQMAAVETLVGILGERTHGLFDTSGGDVLTELAALATVKQFGRFAEAFFGRLVYKCLDYFLSRTLYRHLGEGRRFLTLARLEEFNAALRTHCREAARYVEVFSGRWLSKTRWQNGELSRDEARDFTHGAVAKLLDELKLGAGAHED